MARLTNTMHPTDKHGYTAQNKVPYCPSISIQVTARKALIRQVKKSVMLFCEEHNCVGRPLLFHGVDTCRVVCAHMQQEHRALRSTLQCRDEPIKVERDCFGVVIRLSERRAFDHVTTSATPCFLPPCLLSSHPTPCIAHPCWLMPHARATLTAIIPASCTTCATACHPPTVCVVTPYLNVVQVARAEPLLHHTHTHTHTCLSLDLTPHIWWSSVGGPYQSYIIPHML